MKLLFSNNLLRRMISESPDVDVEAGPSIWSEEPKVDTTVLGEQKVVHLRMALGVLVKQLRAKEQLTIAELAEKAHVAEEELRNVEHDPHYTAKPRLISQLSKYFNVPLSNLSQMAGATHAVDRSLYNAAVRYAAHSDDAAVLSDEEHQLLDAFVATLNAQGKA